jgi:hypothetical protein
MDARDKPGHDGEKNERPGAIPAFSFSVIASEAKQSSVRDESWIASSRSLSSFAHSRDPLAPRNDG